MEGIESLGYKVKAEFYHYRNFKVKEWIEREFPEEKDREIAWKTFCFLKQTYPEVEQVLRGDLIWEEV